MPELDQVDVQHFIERFAKKEKPQAATPKEPMAARVEDSRTVLSHPLVIEMKNDYQSQLMQKDQEIGVLQAKLTSIRSIVGGASDTAAHSPAPVSSRGVDLWLRKFGNSGAGKILRLLMEHPSRKFTRQQVALAVGYSVNAGYFRNCLSQLRTARVMVEQGGEIMINPDL